MNTRVKHAFVIVLVFAGFIANPAKGQTYSLQSLSGDKAVFHLAANSLKEMLLITYEDDTIRVRDVIDVKVVKVLNDRFLLIAYGIMAGTGMQVTRTLILSASNRKICQSLTMESFFKEAFLDFRKSNPNGPMKPSVETLYEVSLTLPTFRGSNGYPYTLHAKIHGERKSVDEPESDYKYDRIAKLNFDGGQHIFYSAREYISRRFTVFDPKTQQEASRYIKGTFPVATFGENKYCFVKGTWYEMSNTDLTTFTYR